MSLIHVDEREGIRVAEAIRDQEMRVAIKRCEDARHVAAAVSSDRLALVGSLGSGRIDGSEGRNQRQPEALRQRWRNRRFPFALIDQLTPLKAVRHENRILA